MRLRLSEITFPTSIEVTEQTVDISYLTDIQKQFYINLLHELIALYSSQSKKRMVVGFAGPSGSGKSSMVEIIRELSQMAELPFRIETLGIDAYTYSDNYLLSHFDGDIALKHFKGRSDTYNVEKLETDLSSFSLGKKVTLPTYSRKIHNPVENVIKIEEERTLLLVEGLWLLYDKNNWDSIFKKLDYSFFISANKDKVKELTIKRHISGGRSQVDALHYYETVDAKNYEEVLPTKEKANKVILSFSDL